MPMCLPLRARHRASLSIARVGRGAARRATAPRALPSAETGAPRLRAPRLPYIGYTMPRCRIRRRPAGGLMVSTFVQLRLLLAPCACMGSASRTGRATLATRAQPSLHQCVPRQRPTRFRAPTLGRQPPVRREAGQPRGEPRADREEGILDASSLG